MGNLALRVEGLGKMYRIGGKQERYATLRDTLTDAVSAPFKRARSLIRGEAYGAAGLKEEIWALKDVSFEVKHGEVVGIIGRNGAGKSTLLKILSRITEPTEGYADVYGRVGSLLEVGTGFHPELTGRENIYLNGAILGMSRAEIDRKFDEIVAFAEIEKFIDTPVKHYSSGMGLRLGFAVAAHLEPEILVVDEVLAVGDAQFQKKCLGKMGEVAGEGRTVLFVSHNMAAVQNLCMRAIILQHGKLECEGMTEVVIERYLRNVENAGNVLGLSEISECRKPGSVPVIQYVRLLNEKGQLCSEFLPSQRITIELGLRYHTEVNGAYVGIGVNDWLGRRVFTVTTQFQGFELPKFGENVIVTCCLPETNLFPGSYRLKIVFGSRVKDIDTITDLRGFTILPEDIYATGQFPRADQGIFLVHPQWCVTE